jgi:hypothetical protein
VLYRHWNAHRITHRAHAVCNQARLSHQTGAKGAPLHSLTRTTAVQVHLVVAALLGHARALREFSGIASTQLQRHRVLAVIKTEQSVTRPVDQGSSRHHFSVKAGPATEATVKVAAMTVCEIHHWCYAETPGIITHEASL